MIIGNVVRLRKLTLGDAQFTFDIRSDPDMNRYFPKLASRTVAHQLEWIKKQLQKDDDYFFIIEDLKGKKLGTMGVYNIDPSRLEGEFGRFVSYGNPLQNLESCLLIYDFAFDTLFLETVNLFVMHGNEKVKSFHEKMGATPACDAFERGGHTYYGLTMARDHYKKVKPGHLKLMEKCL